MTAVERGSGTVDPAEVARFEAMAGEWWDPEGKFRNDFLDRAVFGS